MELFWRPSVILERRGGRPFSGAEATGGERGNLGERERAEQDGKPLGGAILIPGRLGLL